MHPDHQDSVFSGIHSELVVVVIPYGVGVLLKKQVPNKELLDMHGDHYA